MRTSHWLAGLAVAATLLLAGCGVPAKKPSPSPTSTPVTVTPISQAAYEAACGKAAWGQQAYRIGALYFSQGFALTYPSRKLSEGIAQRPLQLADPTGAQTVDAQIPPEPPVNPVMDKPGSGFVVWICNPATATANQSATVRAAALRIDSFATYSAHVDSWNICDGYYTRSDPNGVAGGGCGGAILADEFLHATFPMDAGAGAVVTAAQTGTGTDPNTNQPKPPLPVTLQPGKTLSLVMSVTMPTRPGTYAFSLGLAIDQQAPGFAPVGQPALFAPSAQKWSGKGCLSPNMQAQIPTAVTPPSYYICPEL